MPVVYGLKKIRKSQSYRRSGGGKGEGGLEDIREYYMVFRRSREGSVVVNKV